MGEMYKDVWMIESMVEVPSLGCHITQNLTNVSVFVA